MQWALQHMHTFIFPEQRPTDSDFLRPLLVLCQILLRLFLRGPQKCALSLIVCANSVPVAIFPNKDKACSVLLSKAEVLHQSLSVDRGTEFFSSQLMHSWVSSSFSGLLVILPAVSLKYALLIRLIQYSFYFFHQSPKSKKSSSEPFLAINRCHTTPNRLPHLY
ncbi:uncharacterized protein BT62DRAFT_188607 [Guyanagaster necrorhizus]|uniref:Uncharacterized protein n=1 Tax=Guyanagaster necrorhizus TaxID=856835 RepID=A0A9P8ARV2_9AGAR|nr:uncharacterized protein BT62DRAFT_188607 [Guyanagaster necrorhizus MCA 3950]KAG7445296.1 hypothetical protein BT62DRAFT_188607 [Guyanagaster necrorhizus MCA 3950]